VGVTKNSSNVVPAQIYALHLLGLIVLKDGDIEDVVSQLVNVIKCQM